MAKCDIARIDALLDQQAQPLALNDPDKDAVGAVQDLLSCQGARGLPGLIEASHGTFGPTTQQRVREFQAAAQLPQTGTVDHTTLRRLVDKPATAPRVSQPYVTLVLDFGWGGTPRLVTLTTQFEGGGRFGAINHNHDHAGLSFGLIQWAQKPGRLNELLKAFKKDAPGRFTAIFGNGDAALADGLIAHTAKPGGGVTAEGITTDPRFDLLSDPWLQKFAAAAVDRDLQKSQLACALEAFRKSLVFIRGYATKIKSERGVAFMLDLANQHGDTGAKGIYIVAATAPTEAALMAALETESLRRIEHQFGATSAEFAAGRTRREAFRTSALLADTPYVDS